MRSFGYIWITAILTMDKKDLVNIFDNILKPNGFKRKGNYWRLDGDELIKIVNLQKSQWGNQYYINYGFDFKDLQYNKVAMHIYRRIISTDINESNVLDFGKNFLGDRIKVIEGLLKNILEIFNNNDSIADLLKNIKQRSHLNDVPLKVKEFLGIKT